MSVTVHDTFGVCWFVTRAVLDVCVCAACVVGFMCCHCHVVVSRVQCASLELLCLSLHVSVCLCTLCIQ